MGRILIRSTESVGTDLDPLEVLEGRLEELGQQRELVEALEGLEKAEMRAEELEREVERLRKWEERFPDVDPHNRELMSFTDIAFAVARCNSLPPPGFTDIDPLEILEEGIAKLDDFSPKPCPSPGDVQRWVIPLRETLPPPQQELQSQLAEALRNKAPPKTGSSARGRPTLSAVVGVAAAAAVWTITARLLYGLLTGALVALGSMFRRAGSSRHGPVVSVDIKSLEGQLRERETFDARVAEANRLLREWELPVDPDAAIAEFYNRERAWSELTTERRRLEEMIARRRRFDDGEALRHAERERAFGELRRVVALYGGDASGSEGQVLGEATYLLNDLQRVARERQQDVAEWGRFQEALAGRSVKEWRVEASDARQDAEQAGRRTEELAAKVGGELLGMEEIEAEYASTAELVNRRRRFDDDEARRSAEREQAFEELRRVVVLHGEDGSGDEGEVLGVADGLLNRFDRLAEERRGDIAEWGRFQEALAGRSLEEWRVEADGASRIAEEAQRRADELTADLDGERLRSAGIHFELRKTEGLLREARKEVSRTAGQLEQIDTARVDVATAKTAVDEAKNELDRVLRLQRTLDTAREHLQRAAERAHRLLAPRLETLMSEWIPIISQGRYVDVFVDPETLQVRLRTTNGTIREAALLSHGTAEQVYLVLRMILAQVLTERHERCPMLLDDPSVHADVDRKKEILEYLLQASNHHQVIFFTQDQQVLQWARHRSAYEKIKLIEFTAPVSV